MTMPPMCFGPKTISWDTFPLIPVLFKGSAYDGALHGFTLHDGETGGGKCVPNDCKVLSVVSGRGIIALHPNLPDTSSEELGFCFHHKKMGSGFAISSHHPSKGSLCFVWVLA
jgi:hypothetical protein